MTKFTIFIGHASKKGATKEEIDILVRAMNIIRKYSPIKD